MNNKDIVLRHSVNAELQRKKFITRYKVLTQAILQEFLMFSQTGNDLHIDNINRIVYCDLFMCGKQFVDYFGYKLPHYE